MLDNEQLWAKSEDFAAVLREVARVDNQSRNAVNRVLESRTKLRFVKAMEELVRGVEEEQKQELKVVVKLVHTMPVDKVPYFLALIGFNYVVLD